MACSTSLVPLHRRIRGVKVAQPLRNTSKPVKYKSLVKPIFTVTSAFHILTLLRVLGILFCSHTVSRERVSW